MWTLRPSRYGRRVAAAGLCHCHRSKGSTPFNDLLPSVVPETCSTSQPGIFNQEDFNFQHSFWTFLKVFQQWGSRWKSPCFSFVSRLPESYTQWTISRRSRSKCVHTFFINFVLIVPWFKEVLHSKAAGVNRLMGRPGVGGEMRFSDGVFILR